MPTARAIPPVAGRLIDQELRAQMRAIQDEAVLDTGGGASLTKALVLADLIVTADLRSVVEVGVYRGRLLLPIALLLSRLGRGEIVGIDPYGAEAAVQRDDHDRGIDLPAWARTQDWDGIHAGVLGAIDRWGLGDNASLIRERSQDVANRFAPGSIDLLHIDGNHDADAVAADLNAYLPAVRKDGFVVLDDASWSSVSEHCRRLAAEQELVFSLFDGGVKLDVVGGNDFAVYRLVNPTAPADHASASADRASANSDAEQGRRRGPRFSGIARRRRRTPACEIHTAISPDRGFATRVHYLAATLRRNGGGLADCPLIVTVGGEERVDMEREYPWSRALFFHWRYLDDEIYRRRGLYGTAAVRFTYEFQAPAALIIDADTVFARPIDDALATVTRERAVAGVIAHVSPFIGQPGEQTLWGQIFDAAGLGEPPMVCEHNGWGTLEHDATRRLCPPYYNLGFVLAPSDVMAAVGATILHEMDIVDAVFPTLFRCQLGLTMALLRAGVPWRELPMRFNLPNIRAYGSPHRGELDDVRVIHYLREEEVTRAENFASPESVGEWIARDHGHPINARLVATLRAVHAQVVTQRA